MAPINNNTILLVGGPDTGKTHFGGQLYGRLETQSSFYKITSPPEDLTIFKEVLENLNDGKASGHTPTANSKVLELEIEDNNGVKSVFSFPDYGGEQIQTIINSRRIDKTWKSQIEKSNSWMLFIRPDKIEPLEDITNRDLPEQSVLEKRNTEEQPMTLSLAAFFIELVQMLLYTKKAATKQKVTIPSITVVLSCWDLIADDADNKLPKDILKEKLPAFYSFIDATWVEDSFRVIGLSSTGKTLSLTEPDTDFVKKGPENFGYFINHLGEKKEDLTLSIATVIGSGK